jgi:CubicO group peptidase (beta-lactamase class C family)
MEIYRFLVRAFSKLISVVIEVVSWPLACLAQIEHNFRHMTEVGFNYRTAYHSPDRVAALSPAARTLPLPTSFSHKEKMFDTHEWLDTHGATGLVVLKCDSVTSARVMYENYWRGNKASDLCISWSMGKSFTSALFGCAVKEGRIKSLEQTVTEYCKDFRNGGYDGVRLKDVLQMSSGVRWDENYKAFWSDINVVYIHTTAFLGGCVLLS